MDINPNQNAPSVISKNDMAQLDLSRLLLGLENQKNELGSIADELLELLREVEGESLASSR